MATRFERCRNGSLELISDWYDFVINGVVFLTVKIDIVVKLKVGCVFVGVWECKWCQFNKEQFKSILKW